METILDAQQNESQQYVYAGFWLRFLAVIIDGIILHAAQLALGSIFTGGFAFPTYETSPGLGSMSIVINWLYYAFMESSEKQATLGKMALGIKVIGENGERISFAKATGRYFGKILSVITLGIGFMMAGWTDKKQALHDKLAECLVVLKK